MNASQDYPAMRRILVSAAAASAIAAMGFVGIAAEASARPPRQDSKTCSQLYNETRLAWEKWQKTNNLLEKGRAHRAYLTASNASGYCA